MVDTGVAYIHCKFCGIKFKPSRDWQRFCCPIHQKAYWKEVNPFFLKAKIQKLEDRLKEIEKDNKTPAD